MRVDVAYGSGTDIEAHPRDVGFTPNSGHHWTHLPRPRCAISGLSASQQNKCYSINSDTACFSDLGKMKWFLEIGIFAASILAGLLLADLVPTQLLSKSWRIPIVAVFIAIGITLAIIGFFF